MSLRATNWAAAQPLPPGLRWCLFWLGEHADPAGRGAWPAKRRLATLCQTDENTIKKQLRQLEVGGYIVRGDQRSVAHIPANRRPIVYDLNLYRGTRGDLVTQPSLPDPGGTQHPSTAGDTAPPSDSRGVSDSPLGGYSAPPNQELEPDHTTQVPAQGDPVARARAITDPVAPAEAVKHISAIRNAIRKDQK